MQIHLTRIFIFLISLIAFSCQAQATFRIIEKPITWNAEREQLSLQYLKDRHGLEKSSATIEPKWWWFTGLPLIT
jgi:hypothetical protein